MRLTGIEETQEVQARDTELSCTVELPGNVPKSLEIEFGWKTIENEVIKPIHQLDSRDKALAGNKRFAYMKARQTTVLVIRGVAEDYVSNYTCFVAIAGQTYSKTVMLRKRGESQHRV